MSKVTEEVEVELSPQVVGQIARVAAREASREFYDLLKKNREDAIEERRSAIKGELLKYRQYKLMLTEKIELTPEEVVEYRFDFLNDLMGDSLRNYEADYTEKREIDRTKRIQYRKERIDYAFRCYRTECETAKTNKPEKMRRYREAYAKYIDGVEIPDNNSIAELEAVSEATVFRDLKLALDSLDVYLS